MPRDTQIFSGADHAGHSDYLLPGNSEIRVLAVNANFEDNGAGANWCPAVVMFSDSGHVIARAVNKDDPVTAGDDAEASFFPGVKSGGSGGTGLSAISVNFDVGTGTFGAGSNVLPIQGYSTSDSSLFSVPSLPAGRIDINQDCSLLAVGRLSFDPAFDIADNTILNVLGAPAAGFSGDIAAVPGDATHIIHTSYLDGSTVLAVFAGDSSGLNLQLDGGISNVTAAGLALIKLTSLQMF